MLALEALVVVGWLGVLAYPRLDADVGVAPISNEVGLSLLEAVESEDAEWMGIYMEGQKIGAALSDRVPVADGLKIQERSYLKLRAFGQDKEVTTAFVAHVDREERLSSFQFYLSAPPVRTDVVGKVMGRSLNLEIRNGGDIQKQRINLPDGAPELAVTFKHKVAAQRPETGQTFELPYFDPASMANRRMKVEVLETGTAMIGEEEVETFTLEASYQGFSSKMVIAEDGRTIQEEGALGMTLQAEPRDDALYEGWGDKPPADLIALSIVSPRSGL